MLGYISFAEARATQADALEHAIARLRIQLGAARERGGLRGPGPIFVGIGASLAAACAPVWTLRSRGIHSWRLGAGDHYIPFPASVHPIVGISQSGRSAETLAVLDSIAPALRLAVVNSDASPIADAAPRRLTLGNIPDSYASTIGFTATIAALGLIADVWDGGEPDAGWAELPPAVRGLERELGARAAGLASIFVDAPSIDFVGAAPSAGSAEAGALLFREVARIPSSAFSTRQYLHGSMESAGDGVHVLFGDDRELETADTLARAGHRVLLVTTEPVDASTNLSVVRLLPATPSQRAILETVVLQYLVAEAAQQRGVDIEQFVFHNADTKVDVAAATP